MAHKDIVIVTQMSDAHADDVILALQEMGHEAIRLNSDDIPLNTTMAFGFGKRAGSWKGAISIHTNGRVIDLDTIGAIWWRRPGEFRLPSDLSLQEREFAKDEIEHALGGLWSTLDCYWMSHPEHIRQATWRGSQIRRAAEIGFEVPRTLITTDPQEARAFYDACDRQVVFKVMTDPFLGAPKVRQKYPEQAPVEQIGTHTTLLTEAELDLLDSVRLVPCMFQEYIPKRVELRVTVIGDEIFAAEIDSQSHEKTRIDWRHYDVEIPYRKVILPSEVAHRCLAFVKSYHLTFSAIDLIVTPDGRYVFVENNPNGQFIFVEERVPELRMTEALASCLIRGAKSYG